MTAWKMSRRSSLHQYKKDLFNSDRLLLRQSMFADVTIPSIDAAIKGGPQDIKTEVHVMTSEELPKKNKNFLESLAAKYTFIKIFYEDSSNINFSKHEERYADKLDKNDKVASIRIDDDDAISLDFLNRLSYWMDLEISNFVLSMCFGYGVEFDNNLNITKIGEYRSRLIAAALAYIYTVKDKKYSSVYALGTHVELDQKLPTILDQSSPAFIRSFHKYNDSENTFDKYIPLENRTTSLEDAKKHFLI